MKAYLFTTLESGEYHEYLVREDGELISADKLPTLEKLISFYAQSFDDEFKEIKDVSKICVKDKIYFFDNEDIENKSIFEIKLITGPIMSKVPFSEQEAREYLTAVTL